MSQGPSSCSVKEPSLSWNKEIFAPKFPIIKNGASTATTKNIKIKIKLEKED
jgi:hypothetical protein